MATNSYKAVFAVPGARRFCFAGAIARLPMGIVNVGTVLLVEQMTESFAAAGRVSAVMMLAQASMSPLLARWVDKYGQRRVLYPALVITTISLLALALAGQLRAPEAVLWVCAGLAGASQGSYGAYVRARWAHVLSADRRVQTAFSLEAVIGESAFIVGPIAATFLATQVFPSAALVIAAVVGLVGSCLFLAHKASEPPAAAHTAARAKTADAGAAGAGSAGAGTMDGETSDKPASSQPATDRPAARASTAKTSGSPLRVPGMVAMVVMFACVGIAFGAFDVSTVAFATELGNQGLAGIMVACFAFGSLIAGVIYGKRHWRMSLPSRFTTAIIAFAVLSSALLVVNSLWQLAAVLCIAGLAISPIIIGGETLIQALIPREQLTEGLAWMFTGMVLGTSVGAAAAGWRIDAVAGLANSYAQADALAHNVDGARAGYLVGSMAMALCVLLSLSVLSTLRKQMRQHHSNRMADALAL